MSKKIECRLPDDLCQDLKEFAKKWGVTVTDVVIAGIQDQLHSRIQLLTSQNQPSNDMPAPDIVVPGASDSVVIPVESANKPVTKPIIAKVEPEQGKALPNGYVPKSAQELRAAYKASHPLSICNDCHMFNRDCVCGATVYEPDPVVEPVKQPKVKSNAAPIVKSLLSGISKRVAVAHHATCTCGVCKPTQHTQDLTRPIPLV